jgi:hypothetical protein
LSELRKEDKKMTLAIFIYGLLGDFEVEIDRLKLALAERNTGVVGFP